MLAIREQKRKEGTLRRPPSRGPRDAEGRAEQPPTASTRPRPARAERHTPSREPSSDPPAAPPAADSLGVGTVPNLLSGLKDRLKKVRRDPSEAPRKRRKTEGPPTREGPVSRGPPSPPLSTPPVEETVRPASPRASSSGIPEAPRAEPVREAERDEPARASDTPVVSPEPSSTTQEEIEAILREHPSFMKVRIPGAAVEEICPATKRMDVAMGDRTGVVWLAEHVPVDAVPAVLSMANRPAPEVSEMVSDFL